jgi:hypothetical protein
LRVTRKNSASKSGLSVRGTSVRKHGRRKARGHTVVGFASIATAAIISLVFGIRSAFIEQAALARSQVSFAGQRYASAITSYAITRIDPYTLRAGLAAITANSGANPAIAVGRGTDTQDKFSRQPGMFSIAYNGSVRLMLPILFLTIRVPTTPTAQPGGGAEVSYGSEQL